MNKDIDFTDPQCRFNLLTGLNYYSENFGFEQSKKWALEWVKVHLPDLYDRLSLLKETRFSNRGFVCRMIKNGLQVQDKVISDLEKFFSSLEDFQKYPEDEQPSEKPRKKQPKANEIISKVEDMVDDILADNEYFDNLVVPTDKKQLETAIAWIEKEAVYIEAQAEKCKKILEILDSVYERCGGVKTRISAKTAKPKAATIDKKEAVNLVKQLTYLKEDSSTGLKSVPPNRIIGAKSVILYNPSARVMTCFVAENDEGLSVSRSSIRGYNKDKSLFKILRKPEEVLNQSDLWKGFESAATKPRPAGSHVNENTLILAVK
jgi:hypothetical protein